MVVVPQCFVEASGVAMHVGPAAARMVAATRYFVAAWKFVMQDGSAAARIVAAPQDSSAAAKGIAVSQDSASLYLGMHLDGASTNSTGSEASLKQVTASDAEAESVSPSRRTVSASQDSLS